MTHESNECGNGLGDTKSKPSSTLWKLEPPPEELELPDEISPQEENEIEDEDMIGDDDSMEERKTTQPWCKMMKRISKLFSNTRTKSWQGK